MTAVRSVRPAHGIVEKQQVSEARANYGGGVPRFENGRVNLAAVQTHRQGFGSLGIQQHIGRRPIAAFGNSDGDLQMLQWTAAGAGPRFCLYVHHTDAKRDWAYDRKSLVGKLDKGLDEAKEKGWTVVDMQKEWKVIYPFEKK